MASPPSKKDDAHDEKPLRATADDDDEEEMGVVEFLRFALDPRREGRITRRPKVLEDWWRFVWPAVVAGIFFGGYTGSRAAATKHIKDNLDTIYPSKYFAQRDLNTAIGMGLFRGGARGGASMLVLAGVFQGAAFYQQREYPQRSPVVVYAIAGAASGSMCVFRGGPVGLMLGALLGASVGLTTGGVLQAIDILARDHAKKKAEGAAGTPPAAASGEASGKP